MWWDRTWDAIVVGAGHNGLTAAAYLARAGRTVLVLERRSVVGGACTIEETWPGYRVSPCAYLVGLLHPRVVADLELARHGYQATVIDPQMAVPLPGGGAFVEWGDVERTAAGIGALCPADADGYRRYVAFTDRVRGALRPDSDDDVWLREPPSRDELAARLGHDDDALAMLLERSQVEHLRTFFSDSRMVDALAGQGVIGTFASPHDPGTASVAFHHSSGRLNGEAGAWGFVRGGMGTVSFALAAAARAAGAEVATGVEVGRILPGEGVELAAGGRVHAPVVVSNADPARTVGLLDAATPDRLRRAVEATPMRSPVVKVTYALRGVPSYPALNGLDEPPGSVNVTRGADALDASYRTAVAGGVSDELWCELYLSSAYDDTVAPPGRHLLSAFCQYVPYQLAEGSWDERREEIGDRVDASIARIAPGFRNLVEARHVAGPPDVEAEIGLTGGHIFHGECLPEHMWDRRLPYRTGADGVYLCGAGTHPGGSVIAVNGRNAALAILSDLGPPHDRG